MTPMKWFFSFLKKYRGLMIIGILLTTAVSVLSVVNPYIVRADRRSGHKRWKNMTD